MEGAMKDKRVLEEVQATTNDLADAERELARLLSELHVAPRAEKTTISEALRNAFLKVSEAREHLGKLEMLLRGKDD
jgi:hypothetical protein